MNRRQGTFHDTNRYTQRQDFRYRTYNYRNNRDVQDNTNQRKDFNIYNRYHDNRNNDRQHYYTDRILMTINTVVKPLLIVYICIIVLSVIISVVIPVCIIVLSVIISVVMVPIVNIEILSLICVILNFMTFT
jgi:fatty-acid desaturase